MIIDNLSNWLSPEELKRFNEEFKPDKSFLHEFFDKLYDIFIEFCPVISVNYKNRSL